LEILEHIIDATVHLNLTTRLLESRIFNHLEHIEVSLNVFIEHDEEGDTFYYRNKFRDLLNNIGNAPLLNDINISGTTINVLTWRNYIRNY
jgi:hypothetical protein